MRWTPAGGGDPGGVELGSDRTVTVSTGLDCEYH